MAAGMQVVGVARRLEPMKALAAELKTAKGQLQTDVTRQDDVCRVVQLARDTLGGADVLVNNAGIWYQTSILDTEGDKLRRMIDTNVWGVIMFIKEVASDMHSRGIVDGHIINISSIAGHRLLDIPGSGAYCATKHAFTVISEALRQELRDLGTRISVTNVCPSIVETELFAALDKDESRGHEMFQSNPHLISPNTVVDAIAYACPRPPNVPWRPLVAGINTIFILQIQDITIEPVGEKI